MSGRLLSTVLIACAAIGSTAGQKLAGGEPGDEVFGLARVHPIHFSVAANDYAAMDAPPPTAMFGLGGRGPGGKLPGATGRPGPGDPDSGAGSFGFEFAYVGADLQVGEEIFPKVGLRYKGNGTYLAALSKAKRSFKIDLNKYGGETSWDGLTKLNLNCAVMDSSKAREALAYSVFRAAGVPAPRTALAEVTITVPGKYDKEYLGLYTVVEQVDERFLAVHFGEGTGLLLKPEGIRGLPHFGDDVAAYEPSYNAKSKPGRGDWKRLVEFTRLVNKADDAEFNQEIGAYLDVDEFLRFLAANALLASLDGFIGMGHNYYLYLSPTTGKFAFVPWDLDLAFGSFAIYGSPDQLADLSVDHPHLGENKLIDRLLAMPEAKSAYREHVRRLAAEAFTTEKLGKDLAEIERVTARTDAAEKAAATARREGVGGGMFGGMFTGLPVGTFIEKRVASVAAQLAGKETGYEPKLFGARGESRPRGSGGPRGPSRLDALDADKDRRVSEAEFAAGMKELFVEWDLDKDGTLDKREIAEGVQKLAPAGGPHR